MELEELEFCAQNIIINENIKLQAKIQKLKNKLCESDQKIFDLKLSIDKLLMENNQLKNILPDKGVDDNKRIKEIMNNCEYKKLLSYKSFDAKYLFANIFHAINNGIGNKLMKHIIDNCVDLNIEINVEHFSSTRLIHLFCRHSSLEMIQYLIDKGAELECPNKDGDYPVHLICRYSTFEIIKYIISKGVNIKSNPKIDLTEIINQRSFTGDEKRELLSLIE